MNAWYLLHCKARQENRAQLNIENQGYTICLLQIKRQKWCRASESSASSPYFQITFLFTSIKTLPTLMHCAVLEASMALFALAACPPQYQTR